MFETINAADIYLQSWIGWDKVLSIVEWDKTQSNLRLKRASYLPSGRCRQHCKIQLSFVIQRIRVNL